VVLCDSEILKLLKLIKQQAGNFEHATRMLLFMGKNKRSFFVEKSFEKRQKIFWFTCLKE
jgi:hypothetical protein